MSTPNSTPPVFRIPFATRSEAVACLRLRVDAPGKSKDPGASWLHLAAEYNPKAKKKRRFDARRVPVLKSLLRGEVTSDDDDIEPYIERLSFLFMHYWPDLIDLSVPKDEGMRVLRVRAELLRLSPDHPGSSDEPPSTVQERVQLYLDEKSLSTARFVRELNGLLGEQPLSDYSQPQKPPRGATPFKFSRNFVSRLCAKQPLSSPIDAHGVPYQMFLRAFATHAGCLNELPLLHRLPISARQAQTRELGVVLQVALFVDNRQQAEEARSELRDTSRTLIRRIESLLAGDLQHMAARRGEKPLPTPKARASRPAFDAQLTALRFSLVVPLTSPPPAESIQYVPPLIRVLDVARRLRVEWALSDFNRRLRADGRYPREVCFGIHAGLTTTDIEEPLKRAQDAPTGVVVSGQTFSYMQSHDLRVAWAPQPKAQRPSPVPAPETPRAHAIHGFLVNYFEPIPALSRRADEPDEQQRQRRREQRRPFDYNPSNTHLGVELAAAAMQDQSYWEAAELARKVLALDPSCFPAAQIIIYSYANLGRFHPWRLPDGPAGQPIPASSDDPASRWSTTAEYYRNALDAAPSPSPYTRQLEDLCTDLGCMHMLRALDCWYPLHLYPKPARYQRLVEALSQHAHVVRHVLRGAGFPWATEPAFTLGASAATDIESLLRRAAIDDLYAARRWFQRGVAASLVKTRALFWRLIADRMVLDAHGLRAASPSPSSKFLLSPLREVMPLEPNPEGDEALDRIEQMTNSYLDSAAAGVYQAEIPLQFSVLFWDFLPPTARTRKKTLALLRDGRRTVEQYANLHVAKHSDAEEGITSICGIPRAVSLLLGEYNEAIRRVERWSSKSQQHESISDIYLAWPLSRHAEPPQSAAETSAKRGSRRRS